MAGKKNTQSAAPAQTDTAVVPQDNGTRPAPAPAVLPRSSDATEYHAPQTIGESYDELLIGNIESDLRYSIASRNLAAARTRMAKIKEDCERLVSEIEEQYTEEEAGLAILFIESCRPELVRLYLTINSRVAATKDGQSRIAALADKVIDGYVHRLTKDGADPLSLPAIAGAQ